MSMKSHFFAYISKIRWINRWGLKRNAIHENVMEHSWEVSTIAHSLALIRNRVFDGKIDAGAVAVTALYHDCSEVITGDLPSPIKYHSKALQEAYKSIERDAERELVALLPPALQTDFSKLMEEALIPKEHLRLVKAADTLAAYLKCKAELKAGNEEFEQAAKDIEVRLKDYRMPEVDYFLSVFAPSYQLTLDELLNASETRRTMSSHEEELMGRNGESNSPPG